MPSETDHVVNSAKDDLAAGRHVYALIEGLDWIRVERIVLTEDRKSLGLTQSGGTNYLFDRSRLIAFRVNEAREASVTIV